MLLMLMLMLLMLLMLMLMLLLLPQHSLARRALRSPPPIGCSAKHLLAV